MSVRSGVFVALAFGAAVAYLASLNATRVRVALSTDWAWDVPLVALVVGAFLAGSALAFLFGLARDLRRTYADYQRTRDVRRSESLDELYHRGVDAQLSGRPEAAIQAYGELLKRFPDHAQAHARLGEMALERGDAHGALVHHLDALRTDDRPELVLAAAEDYRRAGRPDDAAAMLERLLVKAPDHLTAMRALRDLSAERGDWTRALQAQERLVGSASPAERSTEQAWLAWGRGRFSPPSAASARGCARRRASSPPPWRWVTRISGAVTVERRSAFGSVGSKRIPRCRS